MPGITRASVDLLRRRIDSLEIDKELLQEQLKDLQADIAQKREHYGNVLAKHIAAERRADKLLLEDRFKIQELENQVATQWKNLAEAKDDANTAKLNQQVLKKSLEQCRSERQQAYGDLANADVSIQSLRDAVRRLERTLTNRVWTAIATQVARLRHVIPAHIQRIKERCLLRFAIRRLSNERLAAMKEANLVVPEKLVKAALNYWEHDKQRLAVDEQIKHIHYGTTKRGTDYELRTIERKPGLWRRLMILAGRA